MEVNTTKNFNLGTEWQIGDSISLNSDREGVIGSGFTTDESSIAYTTDEDLNILSTPRLLTTDNQETTTSTSDNDTYNL